MMFTQENRALCRPTSQRTWRVGGTGVPPLARDCDSGRRGLSVIELLVAMGLMTIILAIAVPRSPKGAFALFQAHQQVLGDLRLARAHAMTRGDHFQFKVTGGNTYEEYRMKFDGASWIPAAVPVRSAKLPAGVEFDAASVGATFEFDTRGLLTPPDTARTIVLSDTKTGHAENATVWASGQVGPV